jgi:metal-responsive CopG/Arc/MetJ family transcriptional regulator
MRFEKIAITIDRELLTRLDRLVEVERFPSRSRAVQEALRDKLDRFDGVRFAASVRSLIRSLSRNLRRKVSAAESKNGPHIERRYHLGVHFISFFSARS